MKNIITLLLLAPLICLSANVATLCPVELVNETAALFGDTPQYACDAQTNIYKICWANYKYPDSATHTNMSFQTLETLLPDLPTLGKSVAVSGIADYAAWLDSIGFVHCDESGAEIINQEEPQ